MWSFGPVQLFMLIPAVFILLHGSRLASSGLFLASAQPPGPSRSVAMRSVMQQHSIHGEGAPYRAALRFTIFMQAQCCVDLLGRRQLHEPDAVPAVSGSCS
ncbi:hypothetical protein CHARACLAT_030377 [Characodon lateralis]|uniref:Secreted protein n=1 Tax=Characodon lateralis TaxID=208331 RepID=A0ABU7DB98_9TELE|nr:hypothetical protein [Characodon lateralis]